MLYRLHTLEYMQVKRLATLTNSIDDTNTEIYHMFATYLAIHIYTLKCVFYKIQFEIL